MEHSNSNNRGLHSDQNNRGQVDHLQQRPRKKFAPQQQADVQTMMQELNLAATITDDFVAAFLQEGLPRKKLDHPSITGLIRKYTEVHGSPWGSLYCNCERVGQKRFIGVLSRRSFRTKRYGSARMNGKIHKVIASVVGQVMQGQATLRCYKVMQ